MTNHIPYTLPFQQISAADLPLVGGKGANLGEMSRASFPVPPGFCVTTRAFHDFVAACPQMSDFYAALDAIPAEDLVTTRKVGEQIRQALHETAIPDAIGTAVTQTLHHLDPNAAYAVRSSATAEDLPDASFAGQQDTYLNVQGEADILDAVRRCWASLFTDRAILYRQRNGFAHEEVALSVVVQQMVLPDISGILFTADPVSQHRHICSIDASYGLGEALVAGLVTADLYRVDSRTHQLIETKIGDKQLAIRPLPQGGTIQETLSDDQRHAQVLSQAQAIALAKLGKRIEAHYHKPQDIEWAIADGEIYLLQTRPITTLFPLPEPQPQDDALHLYVSLSHAQVMLDPVKRLGLDFWRLMFPTQKIAGPTSRSQSVAAAGGRMYIDTTPLLNLRLGRKLVPIFLTLADEQIAAGIRAAIERPEFRQRLAQLHPKTHLRDVFSYLGPIIKTVFKFVLRREPQATLQELTDRMDTLVAASQQRILAQPAGAARLQQIEQEIGGVFNFLLPDFAALVASGIASQRLLAKLMSQRANPDDLTAVARGLSGNVTTEMDLAVGDLADLVRQSPELVAHFQNNPPAQALASAASVPGSAPFLAGWADFLARYGMRGPSEIDISRLRWREDPTSLLQFVIGNLQHKEPGSHRAHHAQMSAAGEAAGQRLIAAAGQGLFGFVRRPLVRRLVKTVRGYTPGREHPKFCIIKLLGMVKPILQEEAGRLVENGRITHPDDIYHLDLAELIQFAANPELEIRPLISQRQAEFARCHKLTPPRLLTSDGEIVQAKISREGLPEGALVGSAASSGTIEGIAKVVMDPTKDVLAKGEILIAPFTDPGWTPLFINAAALVMEVGGLMTHGSVVAREYGIPAVVGVADATRQIQTGQHIRVHGDEGFVEIL
ncbi:MAG: phosphoenolpyruvate synthase [Ardenticatenaceae bacterium]|nr:phosphoenolpyruvate synthase [Ardenticatenaceae bacterium]MCB8949849.1 phosphoenolpyruvate synthase [Ardenticatenaceae bacterium]